MTYRLDTNASVDHLRRGPMSKVTEKRLATPPGRVCLCSVVLGDLIFGAIRSGPLHEAANRAKIAGLQALFPTIPFDDTAAEEYGKPRAHLSVSGSLIGPNDLMIAAIALAAGATLVTHNTSDTDPGKFPLAADAGFPGEGPRVREFSFRDPYEFGQVPGLVLDDWQ